MSAVCSVELDDARGEVVTEAQPTRRVLDEAVRRHGPDDRGDALERGGRVAAGVVADACGRVTGPLLDADVDLGDRHCEGEVRRRALELARVGVDGVRGRRLDREEPARGVGDELAEGQAPVAGASRSEERSEAATSQNAEPASRSTAFASPSTPTARSVRMPTAGGAGPPRRTTAPSTAASATKIADSLHCSGQKCDAGW